MNIKEIRIVTNNVSSQPDSNDYTDILKIKSNCVSYIRRGAQTNRVVSDWAYRSESEQFKTKWKYICKEIENEIEFPTPKFEFPDAPSYCIVVKYFGGKEEKIYGKCLFSQSHLSIFGKLITRLIPLNEDYPDIIEPSVELEENN